MKIGRLLVGVAIGLAAGTLLAPKSGEQMREDLKNKGKDTLDKIKNLTEEDLQNAVDNAVESVKKTIDEFDKDDFVASVKAKLEVVQDKFTTAASAVKESEQFSAVKDNLADVADKINETVADVKGYLKKEEKVAADKIEEEIADVEQQLDDLLKDIEE
ncbi:MAG: YtxH domain-containing protein [Erysipelotrichaceae bacterium]|nr:YtxH domain-containing protein [Erysipelotrichaceae bacterium]